MRGVARLILEGVPVGCRVENKGMQYDVSIAVAKKLGINILELTDRVRLIDSNGILISEEELSSSDIVNELTVEGEVIAFQGDIKEGGY